ncbi:MAG: hydroxyacylglutathione hydrolase [Paracoccaceae bacterium]
MSAEIITIPCLSDNYAFLLHDSSSGKTMLVDAPEADPILAAVKAQGWQIDRVLLTHHHPDHVQGLGAIRDAFAPQVAGCAADAHRLPPLDIALTEGDELAIGGLVGRILDVSGHTINHIAWYVPDAQAVFTADSLMALGCGRVFEGTFEQMHESLQKLAALPPETWVYSGHEYTVANARFAQSIDGGNDALAARVSEISATRAAGKATVPSQLVLELATNPFLRAADAGIRTALGMQTATDAAVFAAIRRKKDTF